MLAAAIVIGLWLDARFPWGQAATSAGVWLLFAWLVKQADRDRRVVLVACLLWATLGECFLSLVWGLYDYRLGNIPLFVPPGHVLLLLLGIAVAERIGERLAWTVPVVAAPLVVWQAWTRADLLGLPLYGVLLLAMWRGRARRLYAAMFVLALAMEFYGTALGNWRWRDRAPWLSWPLQNPPLAAGAFYCLLDALVLGTARLLGVRAAHGPRARAGDEVAVRRGPVLRSR